MSSGEVWLPTTLHGRHCRVSDCAGSQGHIMWLSDSRRQPRLCNKAPEAFCSLEHPLSPGTALEPERCPFLNFCLLACQRSPQLLPAGKWRPLSAGFPEGTLTQQFPEAEAAGLCP